MTYLKCLLVCSGTTLQADGSWKIPNDLPYEPKVFTSYEDAAACRRSDDDVVLPLAATITADMIQAINGLYRAAAVCLFDPSIRHFLQCEDPQAFDQLERAVQRFENERRDSPRCGFIKPLGPVTARS